MTFIHTVNDKTNIDVVVSSADALQINDFGLNLL